LPDLVNPNLSGTKACAAFAFHLAPGESQTIRLRLAERNDASRLIHYAGEDFDELFRERIAEADEFYNFCPESLTKDARLVQRQASAALLWPRLYYHPEVDMGGRAAQGHPPPPITRLAGRNVQWVHLYNDDILSMPDKWEYPWYAAWDLAFHMIPLAMVDPE